MDVKLNEVQRRLRAGEQLYCTTSASAAGPFVYHLTNGGEVTAHQFERVREHLEPTDKALLPECQPLSFRWKS